MHDVEKWKEKAGVSPSKIADVEESPSSPSGSHDKRPVSYSWPEELASHWVLHNLNSVQRKNYCTEKEACKVKAEFN